MTFLAETLTTSAALCITSRFVNCPVSNIQHYGTCDFLLLIDGWIFFLLMFFQFSVLSTIDNAPREHLIESKGRFSQFFVFISATSVKANIISENISANVFFPDSVV